MKSLAITLPAAAASAALVLGCASQRTSPYTQSTPAEFNPEDSDERAVEIVDDMIEELGGLEPWEEARQIVWEQRVQLDDELRGMFVHAWDRWNSRHRWEQPDLESLEAAEAEEDPSLVQVTAAMYQLYDTSDADVTINGQPVPSSDAEEIVEAAKNTFDQSHYFLTGYYKLKDPGVKLSYEGESEPMEGYCEPACSIIHVSFDSEVGDDTYLVHINTESQRPEIIATQTGAGELAYGLAEWKEVAGLSLPVELVNLGNKSERIIHGSVEVGEVNDDLYEAESQPRSETGR